MTDTTLERLNLGQIDCCTIVTQSYRAYVRTLMRSYRQFHVGGRFFVVFIDGIPPGFDANREGCEVISIEDIGIPGLEALRMRYLVKDFCAAIRPSVLKHLFERRASKQLIWLDSDLYFVGPLSTIPSLLAEHSVLLTPQLTAPFPDDKAYPQECTTLGAGVFNSGFMALRNSPESIALLSWWSERLRKYCFRRPEEYMFGDQKWLDLAPYFFTGIHSIDDPSYNVAFWNIHERSVAWDGDHFTARGKPVSFFHMSEFRIGTPPIYSLYMPPHDLQGPLGRLCDLYQHDLLNAGYEQDIKKPYAYDRFENGTYVSPIIRRIYEEIEEDRCFSGLFSTGEGSFFEWLTTPIARFGARSGSLTNLHRELHRLSKEASILFPTLSRSGAEQFAQWLSLPLQQGRFMLDPVFSKTLKPLASRAPKRALLGLFGSLFHGRSQIPESELAAPESIG